MPLILAIEPDRRQAAQLTGVIRRVGAELVLADTTGHALDAIGSRVPDLVLVPALLSPQDDAALAAALRVIAAAAHVRILTTPVLGSTTKRKSSRRVASGGVARSRPRPMAASSVFGNRLDYLKEAAANAPSEKRRSTRRANTMPAGDVSEPRPQMHGAAVFRRCQLTKNWRRHEMDFNAVLMN